MTEVWRPIREFNGMYEVSNLGNVRSMRGDSPCEMKQHVINSGYKVTRFGIKGKSYSRLVHRLVAAEFCEGYNEGFVVNHKDGNRLNNNSENLEWVTQQENIQDCIRRGTFDVKSAHKVAHEKRKRPVQQLNESGDVLNEFESAREAARYIGIHENCISRVCRGERRLSAGYRWKYAQ